MKEFPFDMYHIAFGAVTVASESDVQNALGNGFSFDPPERNNVAFIKAKIAGLEAELAQLRINLIYAEEEEKKNAAKKVEESSTEPQEKEEDEGEEDAGEKVPPTIPPVTPTTPAPVPPVPSGNKPGAIAAKTPAPGAKEAPKK